MSDQLLGPLLDLLARRLRAEAETELTAYGLRPRHVIALTVLRDLGERSQSDLAESLGIDPTNLVALLNELEAEALVTRRRSPQDRRRHTVALTDDGLRRLTEIEHALSGLERRLFSDLSAKDRRALYGLLHRAASATCTSREESAVAANCLGD